VLFLRNVVFVVCYLQMMFLVSEQICISQDSFVLSFFYKYAFLLVVALIVFVFVVCLFALTLDCAEIIGLVQ